MELLIIFICIISITARIIKDKFYNTHLSTSFKSHTQHITQHIHNSSLPSHNTHPQLISAVPSALKLAGTITHTHPSHTPITLYHHTHTTITHTLPSHHHTSSHIIIHIIIHNTSSPRRGPSTLVVYYCFLRTLVLDE